MKFKQYLKDGSADIEFSWKERFRIFFFGKIFLNSVSFKDFVNIFAKIIMEWNNKFNPELSRRMTKINDKIIKE